jgi:uncharacterized protein with von Willebrand factor type A (vWA) domain
MLTENDLVVEDTQYKSQMSTVLMIDISPQYDLVWWRPYYARKKSSHGAGRVNYNKISKDTLDILVFGNDAWTIAIKDLPYLKVGPFIPIR